MKVVLLVAYCLAILTVCQCGPANYTTFPTAIPNYYEFGIEIQGDELSDLDTYSVALTSQLCNETQSFSITSDMVSGNGTIVTIDPMTYNLRAGVYQLCYAVEAVNWTQIPEPLVVTGASSYTLAATPSLQHTDIDITIHGVGLSDGDVYTLAMNESCLGSQIWNVTANMTNPGEFNITIPSVQLGADVYCLCYKSGMGPMVHADPCFEVWGVATYETVPATPTSLVDFNVSMTGTGLSIEDTYAIVLASEDCSTVSELLNVTDTAGDSTYVTLTVPALLGAGHHKVCYRIHGQTTTTVGTFEVKGATSYTLDPMEPSQHDQLNITFHGFGLSAGDLYAIVPESDTCASASSVASSNFSGVDLHVVNLPSITLFPDVYIMCYNVDQGIWLEIGDNFAVTGPASYSIDSSPIQHGHHFNLTIQGYGLSTADQWDLVLSHAEQCGDHPTNISTDQVQHGETITIPVAPMHTESYFVCYQYQGIWQTLGSPLIVEFGPVIQIMTPELPLPFESFNLSLESGYLSSDDQYQLMWYSEGCSDATGLPIPLTLVEGFKEVNASHPDNYTLSIGPLELGPGSYTLCYLRNGTLWVPFGYPHQEPIIVAGAAYFETSPIDPSYLYGFSITMVGNHLSDGHSYSIIPGTGTNSYCEDTLGAGMGDPVTADALVTSNGLTNTSFAIPGLHSKDVGYYSVCYKLNGDVWNVVPRTQTESRLIVAGASYYYTEPSPPLANQTFTLYMVGYGMDITKDVYGVRFGDQGCSHDAGLNISAITGSLSEKGTSFDTVVDEFWSGDLQICFNARQAAWVQIHPRGPQGALSTAPTEPLPLSAFTMTLAGRAGEMVDGDRWAVVPSHTNCSTVTNTTPDVVMGTINSSLIVVDSGDATYEISDLYLNPGPYHVCYQVMDQLWSHHQDLVVNGAVQWTTPSVPLHAIPFDVTITGSGFQAGDGVSFVLAGHGCESEPLVNLTGAMVTSPTSLTISGVSLVAEDYEVCHLLAGANWTKLDGLLVVEGARSWVTDPSPVLRWSNFTLTVMGKGLSDEDRYFLLDIAENPSCHNITQEGHPVIAEDVTSTILNVSDVQIPGATYMICYNTRNSTWTALTPDLFVYGTTSVSTTPPLVLRDTEFTLNIEGHGLATGDRIKVYQGLNTPCTSASDPVYYENVTAEQVTTHSGTAVIVNLTLTLPEGKYTACYHLKIHEDRDLTDPTWVQIGESLSILQGAESYAVPVVQQNIPFNLTFGGELMSDGDAYIFIDSDQDCNDVMGSGMTIANVSEDGTSVLVSNIMLPAGIYRVCYSLEGYSFVSVGDNLTVNGATNYNLLPASPTRLTDFNLTVFGYNFSSLDMFAIVSIRADLTEAECDVESGNQVLDSSVFANETQVFLPFQNLPSGEYRLCYNLGGVSQTESIESPYHSIGIPFSVHGVEFYSSYPGIPLDGAYNFTFHGYGLGPGDQWAMVEGGTCGPDADAVAMSVQADNVIDGSEHIQVEVTVNSSVPFVVCYKLQGPGMWLTIERGGALSYTIEPLDPSPNRGVIVNLTGTHISLQDSILFTTAAGCSLASEEPQNLTMAMAEMNVDGNMTIATFDTTLNPGMYTLCHSIYGSGYVSIGTSFVVSGATEYVVNNGNPYPLLDFNVTIDGFRLQVNDTWKAILESESCADEASDYTWVDAVNADGDIANATILFPGGLEPGTYILCYKWQEHDWLQVGAETFFINGPSSMRVNPVTPRPGVNFQIQFHGQGLSSADSYAIVDVEEGCGNVSTYNTISSTAITSKGQRAQVYVSQGSGQYVACYRTQGGVAIPSKTQITVLGAFSAMVYPIPVARGMNFTLSLTGMDLSSLDQVLLVSTSGSCSSVVGEIAYPVETVWDNTTSANVSILALNAGTYTVCYNYQSLGWAPVGDDIIAIGGASGYATLGSPATDDLPFDLVLQGSYFSSNDSYAIVDSTQACGDAAGIPIDTSWLGTDSIMIPGLAEDLGTYKVCFNFQGLGWLQVGTNLVVVDGAVSYAVTGTTGQQLPWTLEVSGQGLSSTSDRYSLINSSALCADKQDETLPIAVASSYLATISNIMVNAGLYKLCYQVGTNPPRALADNLTISGATGYATDPFPPARNNEFNLTIQGLDVSGLDSYALVEGSLCGTPTGTLVNPTYSSSPDEEVNALGYTQAAGTYTVCYSWQSGPWVPLSPPLVVLGVTGYTTYPSVITLNTPMNITLNGNGLSSADNWTIVAGGGGCASAGTASNDVDASMLEGTTSVSIRNILLSPNHYSICYQLDGTLYSTWVEVGVELVVNGATHLTTSTSDLYVGEPFELTIHGIGFDTQDTWAWEASGDCMNASSLAARDVTEGALASTTFVMAFTELAGNYSVCWNPKSTGWTKVDNVVLNGAISWETSPPTPYYDEVFTLNFHGHGFSTADAYSIVSDSENCTDAVSYPVTLAKLTSNSQVSGTDAFQLPAGRKKACYNINNRGWRMVDYYVIISGATTYTTSPEFVLANRNFELQVYGYSLTIGDLMSLVPYADANPCSAATSISAMPTLTGGADADLMQSVRITFKRLFGDYVVCYNWNSQGWQQIGGNITVTNGVDTFETGEGILNAAHTFPLVMYGYALSSADHYGFVPYYQGTCASATPIPVQDLMVSGPLENRVVNITDVSLGANVWRVCYKLGTNDWLSLEGNITVTGASFYAINDTQAQDISLTHDESFFFEMYGVYMSTADQYVFYPHRNKCPDISYTGLAVEAPEFRDEGEGRTIIDYTHSLSAGEYTVCYKWQGYEYIQIGQPLIVQGPMWFYTDPSPPSSIAGSEFTVHLIGNAISSIDPLSVVEGSDCDTPTNTHAPTNSTLTTTYTGASRLEVTFSIPSDTVVADPTSLPHLCYTYLGTTISVPFHGVDTWVSTPTTPNHLTSFSLVLHGMGFSIWDEYELVSARDAQGCAGIMSGKDVSAAMVSAGVDPRTLQVGAAIPGLVADEYRVCYSLDEYGWAQVQNSVYVQGPVWVELSPAIPLHNQNFAITIHGVDLASGDEFGVIESNAGCDAIGTGTDVAPFLTADTGQWFAVTPSDFNKVAGNYIVCYKQGSDWVVVGENLTVSGVNSYLHDPATLADNQVFDMKVQGHKVSVYDMYEFTSHPDGCNNVTGWDVFPWQLGSSHDDYNTTVYLPNQKLVAGVYKFCYYFNGLGWAQLGSDLTVHGSTGFDHAPENPERRTYFAITVTGHGFASGDSWALVFGDNQEDSQLCYNAAGNIFWIANAVQPEEVSNAGQTLTLNASVMADVWKVARVWTLCYNVGGIAYGWEPVPGSSIHFIDKMDHVRVEFSCSPEILENYRTAKCTVTSFDSAGNLFGSDNDTASFAMSTSVPSGARYPYIYPITYTSVGTYVFYLTPYQIGTYDIVVTHSNEVVGTESFRLRVFQGQERCRDPASVDTTQTLHASHESYMNKDSLLEPRNHGRAWAVYPNRNFPDYDVPRTLSGHLEYAPTKVVMKGGLICETLRIFEENDDL